MHMLQIPLRCAQKHVFPQLGYASSRRLFHATSSLLKKPKKSSLKSTPTPNTKPPGPPRTKPTVHPPTLTVSKSISWLLRHGAAREGLPMRSDGYVPVEDFLRHPTLRGVDMSMMEKIVANDSKNRFHLFHEPRAPQGSSSHPNVWWIRANQGHTLTDVKLDLQPITDASQVKMAVHGTSVEAWKLIAKQGLSRMGRQHIHLAQGITGPAVVSGMRSSSRVLVFIDLRKALHAGIEFYVSSNGVVLTPGNELGILETRFFERVEMVGTGVMGIPGRNEEGGGKEGSG
ncbi:KptA family-domain-containing protein [Lyophyllum atratum]|nr:KptA family-domain-containing protein [Lyophyllum atratum]